MFLTSPYIDQAISFIDFDCEKAIYRQLSGSRASTGNR